MVGEDDSRLQMNCINTFLIMNSSYCFDYYYHKMSCTNVSFFFPDTVFDDFIFYVFFLCYDTLTNLEILYLIRLDTSQQKQTVNSKHMCFTPCRV